MKKDFEKLGQALRRAREKMGFGQREFARKIGIHNQFVSNWERGLCAPPEHSFHKVIDALKINRTELVEVMLLDAKTGIRAKIYPKKKRLSA
jgi:transcriptional regulator with XRE-family HTH domain